nr:MAG TPA: hypothetical protein [Caudoviricetes sp.]
MKGIIDINIKHKDGSTETRHEHNVVFDLQALKTNYFYNRPYGPLTGYLENEYISSSTYDDFSLSTLELDLTRPSVAIPALNSITSGSSSVWYTAPITSTIEDKYRISSATWTVGEAITLKSIFFPYNNLYFADDRRYGNSTKCVLCDDGLFVDPACCIRLPKSMDGFKFTNKYLNGFCDYSVYNTNYLHTPTELAFIPYKLHNPTERFLFDTVSGTTHAYSHYPIYTTGELQIKDAATNTVKRSFALSQFADFSTNEIRAYARVINTGSKNFLLQPVSTAEGMRAWEIPDTETTETIQPAGMILAGKGMYMGTGSYDLYLDAYLVADNVLMWTSRISGDYRMRCAKINDDLSVDFVPGANAAGEDVSPSTSYNSYLLPYMNTDSLWLYRNCTNSSYNETFRNGGSYNCHFFNSTAANFSTPIVLAEGDVLTVSYKIEVA